MRAIAIHSKNTFNLNDSVEGESLEKKVKRIVENSEPISDGAPIIYTERGKGVQPEYNIRTDRFDIAVDAMGIVSKSRVAKREKSIEIIKDEPIQGKSNETDTTK